MQEESDLISDTIMKLITPKIGTGIMALLCRSAGNGSTSSSGVVMPTLIPVAGSIAASMGQGITANMLIAGVCSGANSAFYRSFSSGSRINDNCNGILRYS